MTKVFRQCFRGYYLMQVLLGEYRYLDLASSDQILCYTIEQW